MSSIHEEQETQVNRYGSLIAEESNGTQDYEMPQEDGMAVRSILEYFGKEDVPVFVKFILFHWHNMPILWTFAVNFLVLPLDYLSKSMKIMIQGC